MHPVIDPPMVQAIIVAILAGGVATKIIDITYDRWKQASGRKRSHVQQIADLREALARCRFLAIKAGVDPDDLPDDPTDTQTS